MNNLKNNCWHILFAMERTFEVASAVECDLAIHCESCVFHVHRSVLSLASPVWNRMLNGAFAESTSSAIVFEEDNPYALTHVLEILYHPERFTTYHICAFATETETEAIVEKYQLYGVQKMIANMKANKEKIERLKVDQKEFDKLQAELQVLRRMERMQPGRQVRFSDEPPVGTRVSAPHSGCGVKGVKWGWKGEITQIWSTSADVKWDNWKESSGVRRLEYA